MKWRRLNTPTKQNLLLAATLARGITVLRNCAREPEVIDLVAALCAMGADIEGAGAHEITVRGCAELRPYIHRVIADCIECGTFLIAGALAGDRLMVVGGVGIGVAVDIHGDRITVARPSTIGAVDAQTAPYQGFLTDMQAQFMVLLASGKGTSVITETIFENCFMHVAELNRLGANISVEGGAATVNGIPQLSGSTVTAPELRASACLVLAGLVADGETVVRRIDHLDRGYEHLEVKLRAVGARITRFTEVQARASVRHPRNRRKPGNPPMERQGSLKVGPLVPPRRCDLFRCP